LLGNNKINFNNQTDCINIQNWHFSTSLLDGGKVDGRRGKQQSFKALSLRSRGSRREGGTWESSDIWISLIKVKKGNLKYHHKINITF